MIKKIGVLTTLLLAGLALAGCSSQSQYSVEAMDTLATCLSDKGVQMFGADRCPHCQAQKKMFGDARAKIDYIECEQQAVQCDVAGIQGYPTWRGPDGLELQGEQAAETLAQAYGCPLPTDA